METPAVILHSRRGLTPCLTRDLLDAIPGANSFHVPIGELVGAGTPVALTKNGTTLHHFLHYEGFNLVASVRDPLLNDFGPANPDTYTVGSLHGKTRFTPLSYMEAMRALRPNVVCSLSDEITSLSSMSRASKSVSRSVQWLDKLLALHEQPGFYTAVGGSGGASSEEKVEGVVGKPLLFATVQGGVHVDLRTRCASEMAKRAVDGFVLGGLCCGESSEVRNSVIAHTMTHLPSQSPKLLPGTLTPLGILDAVARGVDLFDSPYPQELTRLGYASTYLLSPSASEKSEEGTKIALRDGKYERSSLPLVQGCACYTCGNHTRAYIHHLLNVHEMLGDTLLQVHNVHHFLRFFDAVRLAIKEGCFDAFKTDFAAAFIASR